MTNNNGIPKKCDDLKTQKHKFGVATIVRLFGNMVDTINEKTSQLPPIKFEDPVINQAMCQILDVFINRTIEEEILIKKSQENNEDKPLARKKSITGISRRKSINK